MYFPQRQWQQATEEDVSGINSSNPVTQPIMLFDGVRLNPSSFSMNLHSSWSLPNLQVIPLSSE
jgi:hypothetical protein